MPFATNDGRRQPLRAGKHLSGIMHSTSKIYVHGMGYLSLKFSEGFDHTEPPAMSLEFTEEFDS